MLLLVVHTINLNHRRFIASYGCIIDLNYFIHNTI